MQYFFDMWMLLNSNEKDKIERANELWNKRIEHLKQNNLENQIYNCSLDDLFWKLVDKKFYEEANFVFTINPSLIDLTSQKTTPYQNIRKYIICGDVVSVKFLYSLIKEQDKEKNFKDSLKTIINLNRPNSKFTELNDFLSEIYK